MTEFKVEHPEESSEESSSEVTISRDALERLVAVMERHLVDSWEENQVAASEPLRWAMHAAWKAIDKEPPPWFQRNWSEKEAPPDPCDCAEFHFNVSASELDPHSGDRKTATVISELAVELMVNQGWKIEDVKYDKTTVPPTAYYTLSKGTEKESSRKPDCWCYSFDPLNVTIVGRKKASPGVAVRHSCRYREPPTKERFHAWRISCGEEVFWFLSETDQFGLPRPLLRDDCFNAIYELCEDTPDPPAWRPTHRSKTAQTAQVEAHRWWPGVKLPGLAEEYLNSDSTPCESQEDAAVVLARLNGGHGALYPGDWLVKYQNGGVRLMTAYRFHFEFERIEGP